MASPSPAGLAAPSLLGLCVMAACHDKSSVKAWRQKRRTLEMLPSELASQLFHSLLQAHLLSATLVEYVSNSSLSILIQRVHTFLFPFGRRVTELRLYGQYINIHRIVDMECHVHSFIDLQYLIARSFRYWNQILIVYTITAQVISTKHPRD